MPVYTLSRLLHIIILTVFDVQLLNVNTHVLSVLCDDVIILLYHGVQRGHNPQLLLKNTYTCAGQGQITPRLKENWVRHLEFENNKVLINVH